MSQLSCFIMIKCREALDYNLPTKVIAPIGDEGVAEHLRNEFGDLPSMGGKVWQQVLGKLASSKGMDDLGNLQNILAAESLWIGGNKRIFTFNLGFYAYEDAYKEVYLPIRTLQMMSVPRSAPEGKGKGFVQAAHNTLSNLGDAMKVDTFWYRTPPQVSLVVYSILTEEYEAYRKRKKVGWEIKDVIEGRDASEILTSKSILVYVPKAMISSLSISWLPPFQRGRQQGVYPSQAKAQIQIDTLRIFTSGDIALEKPDKSESMALRGVANTYYYN